MYTKHKWNSDIFYNFGYLQYLPKDFDKSKEYPLVLYLHGAGERGDNADTVANYGYLQHIKNEGAEYPFIIVAPQCPAGKYWGCFNESLLHFLDYLCAELPVDKTRVYLTGNSMGGTGTYMLSMAAPERFAAIAPVCGTGICWNASAIKDLPIYIYHGDCDNVVPIYESITMLKCINSIGGKAIMKICHGVGHNAWDIAYAGDELYNWLLKFKKE